ncbi:MAG: hypothetical protein ABGW90_06725, partial [Martelella sp.]
MEVAVTGKFHKSTVDEIALNVGVDDRSVKSAAGNELDAGLKNGLIICHRRETPIGSLHGQYAIVVGLTILGEAVEDKHKVAYLRKSHGHIVDEHTLEIGDRLEKDAACGGLEYKPVYRPLVAAAIEAGCVDTQIGAVFGTNRDSVIAALSIEGSYNCPSCP